MHKKPRTLKKFTNKGKCFRMEVLAFEMWVWHPVCHACDTSFRQAITLSFFVAMWGIKHILKLSNLNMNKTKANMMWPVNEMAISPVNCSASAPIVLIPSGFLLSVSRAGIPQRIRLCVLMFNYSRVAFLLDRCSHQIIDKKFSAACMQTLNTFRKCTFGILLLHMNVVAVVSLKLEEHH